MDNFVKEGLTEGETPLMKSHEAMVKTAREARLAVLNFIRNPVGGAVNLTKAGRS